MEQNKKVNEVVAKFPPIFTSIVSGLSDGDTRTMSHDFVQSITKWSLNVINDAACSIYININICHWTLYQNMSTVLDSRTGRVSEKH